MRSRPHTSLCLTSLPEAEKPHAHAIQVNLSTLGSMIARYQCTVELFNYAGAELQAAREVRNRARNDRTRESEQRMEEARAVIMMRAEWQLIASRDGGLTLYHCAQAMSGVKTNVQSCPTIRKDVNVANIDRIRQDFGAAFPDAIDTRHAVAHEAELTRNPKRASQTALSGPLSSHGIEIAEGTTGVYIGQLLQGNEVVRTHEGRQVVSSLSLENVQKLLEFEARLHREFEAVEIELEVKAGFPRRTR